MNLELLIKRAVHFDLDAQKELFILFHHRLWNLCRKYLKNKTDAEDLLYCSYQSFFKTLHKFRYSDDESVMKWLAGIAYINTQEHQRKKFRWVLLQDDMEIETSVLPDVENKMDHATLLSMVMKHKDNKYVMAFILHVVMDWDHEEISGRFHLAKRSSHMYVSRGRRHLQDQLRNAKNSFI